MPCNLQLSVGYQLPDLYEFVEIVREYSVAIGEVYFPWLGVADGRGRSIGNEADQRQMEAELTQIHSLGIKLNLLWNATCYGRKAISRELEQQVITVIRYLSERIGLDSVTTTSLFVAETVKTRFPRLDVRASVNMGIGSVSGMKYVKDYFDSFYVKRELNRYPSRIRPLREWCNVHGKQLYLLANSGCLKECSVHGFHDGLVAHERELETPVDRWRGFPGICWAHYAEPANHYSFLHDSTWIRPEDIDRYVGLADGIKLATRSHRDPIKVIVSYAERKFDGNILALCEPDFSSVCYLENSLFPIAWADELDRLSETEQEPYCKEIFNHVNR